MVRSRLRISAGDYRIGLSLDSVLFLFLFLSLFLGKGALY